MYLHLLHLHLFHLPPFHNTTSRVPPPPGAGSLLLILTPFLRPDLLSVVSTWWCAADALPGMPFWFVAAHTTRFLKAL